MTLIAATIQAFFSDRLAGQLQASPRTIASYRDTLRLLLHYTHQHTGKPPSALDWEDLNEELISGSSSTSRPCAGTRRRPATCD